MTPSALDIGATLILVLPGFLSYRAALARRADPSRRSVLWQLAEMLEYSVYVHILGIGLLFFVTGFLGWFHVETHLSELPAKKPHEFLTTYFVEGVLLFTLYPLYVVGAAVVMGAYDVPNHTATGIVRGVGLIVRLIGAIPWLPRLRPPTPNFPVEPVWYRAFNVATDGFTTALPDVIVKMKRGDIYYGKLSSYPIELDTERAKDFLIIGATYLPENRPGRSYALFDQEGGGTVLLNSADVDSIQVYYAPPTDEEESFSDFHQGEL